RADGTFGVGLNAERRSSVSMRWSLVERNRTGGALLQGSQGTFEGTLVTDQLPEDADQGQGYGIGASDDPDTAARSTLTITGSGAERAAEAGVGVIASDAVIEGTATNDISAQRSKGRVGRGISTQKGATATITSSSIERCLEAGVVAIGGKM